MTARAPKEDSFSPGPRPTIRAAGSPRPRFRCSSWLVPAMVSALALTAACGTPPKPRELDAFERLRADPFVATAAKRSPDLVKGADRWADKAREQWNDNDLQDATHSALMAQIKLKQAVAVAEQERAKARSAAADKEMASATEEVARLSRELANVKEHSALLKRLAQLDAEKKSSAEQLAAERVKAAASEKMSEAEIALRSADTVNAKKHASAQYSAATDMLSRAQQEFQQSSFQAAQMSAEFAKKKADEAAEVAKPLHNQETEAGESRARAEELSRDAAGIPRVVVNRDAKGSLQRLVLGLPAEELFTRRETTIAPGRDGVLHPVAALLKKYPTYPVQIIGYTDSRGRPGELLALSLARAQSVYSALVLMGVDGRRVVVSGQGPADPVSDNRTVPGRQRNNRVEIVFLYQ